MGVKLRGMGPLAVLLVVALVAGPHSAPVMAAMPIGPVVFVDDDAPANGTGATWESACRLLQDAFEIANDPDNKVTEIRIAEGTYQPDLGEGVTTGDRRTAFRLRPELALRGGYAGVGAIDPDERDPSRFITMLTGDLAGNDVPPSGGFEENAYHVVIAVNTDETAILDGLHIVGGNADGDDGDDRGGGVFISGGGPTIVDCVIRDNRAIVGGGVHVAGGGVGETTFERVDVAMNHAMIGGGMHLDGAAVMIVDGTIQRNTAVSGGGVYADGATIEVINTAVTLNAVTFSGGGLYAVGGSVALTGATLGMNLAEFDGGGAYVLAAECSAVNSTIFDNAAALGAGMHVFGSTPTFTSCVFSLNDGDEGAGLSLLDADAALTACTFLSNSAGVRGGGVLAVDSIVSLFDVNFSDNFGVDGGAMHLMRGVTGIDECDFNENTAGNFGGGVAVNAGTVDVTRSRFIENRVAFSFVRDGGAINARSEAMVTVHDTEFEDNEAGFGGTIWIAESTLLVTESTIDGGRGVRGGAVHGSDSTIDFEDCVLIDNDTSESIIAGGGAMYLLGGSLDVVRCLFDGNQGSDAGGGAIFTADVTILLDGTVLTNNGTSGHGGAVNALGGTTTIVGCAIVGNDSFSNGGAVNSIGGQVNVLNCTMSHNTAGGDGGGIAVFASTLEVIDAGLRGNTSGALGGAIAMTDTSGVVASCQIVSNAAVGGGGVLASGPGSSISGSLISGNVARGFEDEGACTFGGLGGGVWAPFSPIDIANCTIVANRAECNGTTGGVFAGVTSIANSILWDNSDDAADVETAQITVAPGSNVDYCCVQGLTGALGGVGNIGDDPQFADPNGPDGFAGTVDDDLRPIAGSPCNDVGRNDLVPPTLVFDLDGRPRILEDPIADAPLLGAVVDMGAYETDGQRRCVEDLDLDGTIGFGDLLEVLGAWGTCGGCREDTDLDGSVGFSEVLAIVVGWGVCE